MVLVATKTLNFNSGIFMILGLLKKEVRSYSLLNALGHIKKGSWDQLGVEREASDAIADRYSLEFLKFPLKERPFFSI
jgi:hypothetical protein